MVGPGTRSIQLNIQGGQNPDPGVFVIIYLFIEPNSVLSVYSLWQANRQSAGGQQSNRRKIWLHVIMHQTNELYRTAG